MASEAIEATYNGRPLAELQKLIELRTVALGETIKDSVVATTITVLQSLRKASRVAPTRTLRESAIGVNGLFYVRPTSQSAGWMSTGGSKHRCVRSLGGSALHDAHPVNLMGSFKPGETPHVFEVRLSKEAMQRWPHQKRDKFFVIAPSISSVKSYCTKRFGKIVRNDSGLARQALTTAMRKVHQVGAKDDAASSRIKAIAASQVMVSKQRGDGNAFGITVSDNVVNAMAALPNGQATIDEVMGKATRRITGMIKHKFETMPPFDTTARRAVKIAFPELN